jgi:hypothetical protein
MGRSFDEQEKGMTRRPGDKTREPPGGRAAERLRMFEEARGVKEVSADRKKSKAGKSAGRKAPARKKRG